MSVATVEVIGVYPVLEAAMPCHLIELRISGFVGRLDFLHFTQERDGADQESWEVAYDEYLLDEQGTSGQPLPLEPLNVQTTIRVAFFFHSLDLSRHMNSPFGPVLLPAPAKRPDRLNFIEYWMEGRPNLNESRTRH